MSLSRRRFLQRGLAAAAAGMTGPLWAGRAAGAAAVGPFQPNWDSLAQYQCPEWFRDAKFGIWAHWTAQCVPEQGDWYAQRMYKQGDRDYDYQCAHYGHPSKVGFKDIDHLWNADPWDPDHLIGLYKAAGAKYFMALGNHHDNFDTWDSKFQPWNSVAIGPKRNIIAGWEKAVRANGLRFAVSCHAARSWTWFDVSHGSDKTGPLAGVPYDGSLTKADGKGQWWEGLDPQDLYSPPDASRTPELLAAYNKKFYNRVADLTAQHHPDLIYFDDGNPPTSYGLQIVADYYNQSALRNGGKPDVVMTVKNNDPKIKRAMVLDYERGRSDEIAEYPWQTDTCIGNWHYDRYIFEHHHYKTPDQVVKMLMDIVSKNGNLMLNIPLPGNGVPDSDELAFIAGMTAWMKVNDEAVFASRPWTVPSEGPTVLKAGKGFSEGGEDKLTDADWRFTTKKNALYATAMGWPESGSLTLRALAASAPGIAGDVKRVSLLGHGPVPFQRTAAGLVATMPQQKPCDHAYVLKIEGLDVANSKPITAPGA